MAAVTVTTQRENVNGSYRERYFIVNIAADADTLATGLHYIVNAVAESQNASNTSVGTTISGGTITFQTAGAETGVLVRVTGN